MSKVDFKLNSKGVRELLRSSGAMGICEEYAGGVLARAGEGFEVTTMVGKNRANASVSAVTYEARKRNYGENILLKSLK